MSRNMFRVIVLGAGLAVAMASRVAGAGEQTAVEAALATAESLHAQVVAAGHDWLGTHGRLDEARAAATAGDTALALRLLEQVRRDCELALEQAQREDKAWPDRVLR